MIDAVTRRSGAERLATGYAGRLSLTLGLGALAFNLGRQALPPLLPAVIGHLRITPAEAGVALTVLWGVYAVLQYPSGRASDALSRKTVLNAGLVVSIAGFALLSQVRTYPLLLASAALLGVGSSLFLLSMRALLSDLYVERRGAAFGINTAAGQLGSVLAAGLAVAALAVATWRAAFVPVVGLLGLILLLSHRYNDEPYRVSGVSLDVRATVARVYATPHIRRLVIAYTLVIFTWNGVVGFLPTFFQVEKGFSPALAGGGFAALFAVGMVVQPIAGGISDRTDRLPVAAAAVFLSAIGLGMLVTATSPVPIAGGMLVFATGLLSFPPIVQAYLMDVFPEANKGGDLGAFKTVYEGVASLGPAYVGFLAVRADYTTAFAGLIACLALSGGLVLYLSRAERP